MRDPSIRSEQRTRGRAGDCAHGGGGTVGAGCVACDGHQHGNEDLRQLHRGTRGHVCGGRRTRDRRARAACRRRLGSRCWLAVSYPPSSMVRRAASDRSRDGRFVSLPGATDLANSEPRPWGANNPQWRLFAFGRLTPGAYVIAWVADDPAENDGDATRDGTGDDNPGSGILALRAEAFGLEGAHKVLEATVPAVGGRVWRTGYRDAFLARHPLDHRGGLHPEESCGISR